MQKKNQMPQSTTHKKDKLYNRVPSANKNKKKGIDNVRREAYGEQVEIVFPDPSLWFQDTMTR